MQGFEVLLKTWHCRFGLAILLSVLVGCGSSTPPGSGPANGQLQLTEVSSTGATSVRVRFNQAAGEGAAEAGSYTIVDIASGGALVVEAASLSGDGREVTLSTDWQADTRYRLSAELPGLTGTASAEFQGTFVDPVDNPNLDDSNGDGLADIIQTQGWYIEVDKNGDGERERYRVTSDPLRRYSAFAPCKPYTTLAEIRACEDAPEHQAALARTLTDLQKFTFKLDPNTQDTDGDGLSDFDEIYLYNSDPRSVDTAGDAKRPGGRIDPDFFDGAKVARGLSPILKDTTGDGYEDAELEARGRNPRLAYVPKARLELATDIVLELNYQTTSTDGVTEVDGVTSSAETTIERAHGTTTSRSDTRTHEHAVEVGLEKEVGVKSGVTASLTYGYTNTSSVTTTNETRQESRRALTEALEELRQTETAQEFSVTKTSGLLTLGVELVNDSEVTFALSNPIVSVLWFDSEAGRYQSLSTLEFPTSTFTLSPGASTGTITASESELNLALFERVMQNPSNLIFEVANWELTDEHGQNFEFRRERVGDLTSLVIIDTGDEVRRYHVATNLHRKRVQRGDIIDIEFAGMRLEYILNSLRIDFETATDESGRRMLTSLNGLSEDSAKRSFWAPIVSHAEIAPAGADFEDFVLKPGQTIILAYVEDRDGDGLNSREEFIFGTSDETPYSAGFPPLLDGESEDPSKPIEDFTDYFKARVGWEVAVEGEAPYHVYPDPALIDSNGDGCSDYLNWVLGTDPHKVDTSGDGLSDCQSPNPLKRLATPEIGEATISIDHPLRRVTLEVPVQDESGIASVIIDWGDGSSTDVATLPGGKVVESHSYSDIGSYVITLTATNNQGLTSTASYQVEIALAVSPIGLAREYLFDNVPSSGGQLEDTSGNNRHAALGGNPGCSDPAPNRDGQTNRALALNIEGYCGSHVSGYASADEIDLGSAFTYALWLNTDTNVQRWVMGHADSQGSSAWGQLVVGETLLELGAIYEDVGQSGHVSFVLHDGTTAERAIVVTDPQRLDDYGWTFYAVTVEASGLDVTVKLYRGDSGTPVAQASGSGDYRNPYRGTTQAFYIGQRGSNRVDILAGYLDDMRIYTRALSSEEIRSIYQIKEPIGSLE
jgi:hypothetical protein